MKFQDKKEEVVDVQLTQYGKYLLSLGKFHPEYYAFFDNDVMYDGAYAGLSEDQNDVYDRVREVPRFEAQYLFHGTETEVKKINKLIRLGEIELGSPKVQPSPEKHYSLTAPIGTISLDSFWAPAWSINFLRGEISGAVHYKEGDHPTQRIPQLELNPIEYFIAAKELSIEDEQEGQTNLGSLSAGHKFSDGSFFDVVEDEIVLNVEEANSIFGNENFEIEVFLVEEENENGEKENLIPLFFASKKREFVRNGILLDESEIKEEVIDLDASCVEYFFEVLTDEDVELEENIRKEEIQRRLYSSSVKEEDLCKD